MAKILVLFGADSSLKWGRSCQLAKAFRRLGHSVFYIDLPQPIYKDFNLKRSRRQSRYKSDTFQPRYALAYGKLPFLREINRKIVYRQINRILFRKEFVPDVLWIYTPYEPLIAKHLIEIVKPNRIVYDCADERVAMASQKFGPTFGKKLEELEAAIFNLCDTVFVVSHNLKVAKKKYHKRIFTLPNGVDSTLFNSSLQQAIPNEYKAMSGSIVLYAGSMETWVDHELIVRCAREYRNLNFVLIGPGFDRIKHFCGIDNLHRFGPKKYESLPSYIKFADLCIMPFREAMSLRYSNSLKALQYLSMEKKVLSTEYEGIETYQGLVKTAADSPSFVRMIKHMLECKESEEEAKLRENVVKTNSWDKLAEKALNLLR